MTVIPLFPPGVHDIVANDLGDGTTEFVCSFGDYTPGIVARTDNADEMRWARLAAYEHAVRHRRRPCHSACIGEPECGFGGEVM